MVDFRKIFPSFASGELSPFLYSRVDLQRYQIGLKTCRNFMIHPHGGASNRPGTKYVAAAKYSDKKCRLVKFVFSKTQAYVLEFGENYIRFFTDDGQILADTPLSWNSSTAYVVNDYCTHNSATYRAIQSGTNKEPDVETTYWAEQNEYEIYSPYSEDDLADLRFESSADVIYIMHPDHQTRTLTRYGDASWVIGTYAPDDGPFMPENVDETISLNSSATTGSVSLNSTAALFDADHVGALWKLTHYIEGQTAASSFTGTGTGTAIKCFTTWRVISHGTWTGKFRIEKSTDGGTTWTTLRAFTSANDYNANTSGTEDIESNPEPFLVRANCYAYTSGTLNVDLTTDPFYQNGIVEITAVHGTKSATVTVLQDVGLTTNTTAWSEGAWSDYRGWPACGTFHKDRFCLAATASEPMNIWMSKTGNYTSHGVSQSVLDTDAINITLLSRQLNAINGLVSLGDLLAFTNSSEWKISAEGGVLTPTSAVADVQGNRGSSGLTPIVIGSQIIYVQANGKVVRNFAFNLNDDKYVGNDLRILSEHLFTGYELTDMAYQQDNDSIIWFVRNDGELLGLTYMPEQDVIAWSRHDTDGEVESICVIPGDGYDELWMVVNRDTGRFIERMVERMASTDVQQQFFVDCGMTYDAPLDITNIIAADPVKITCTGHGLTNGDYVDISDVGGMTELNGNRYIVANATANDFTLLDEDSVTVNGSAYTAYTSGGHIRKAYTTFSGLDHLEGLTVAILGNGSVYPEDVVDGGAITLSTACSIVHIGLPYTADLETLNIEVAMASGTTQGRKVKIGQVTFNLINARGGWIGPDEDNLFEAFTPTRLSLGAAPALYTGSRKEVLGAGYQEGGRIFYRQSDPLPITITSLIPEVTVGG